MKNLFNRTLVFRSYKKGYPEKEVDKNIKFLVNNKQIYSTMLVTLKKKNKNHVFWKFKVTKYLKTLRKSLKILVTNRKRKSQISLPLYVQLPKAVRPIVPINSNVRAAIAAFLVKANDTFSNKFGWAS